jgi:hypothetical protein
MYIWPFQTVVTIFDMFHGCCSTNLFYIISASKFCILKGGRKDVSRRISQKGNFVLTISAPHSISDRNFAFFSCPLFWAGNTEFILLHIEQVAIVWNSTKTFIPVSCNILTKHTRRRSRPPSNDSETLLWATSNLSSGIYHLYWNVPIYSYVHCIVPCYVGTRLTGLTWLCHPSPENGGANARI